MKTPPATLALNRLSALLERYNALPDWLIESQGEAFEKWEANIDDAIFALRGAETVSMQMKENLSMWEHAMNHWERTVRAHEEETAQAEKGSEMEGLEGETMAKAGEKKIKTERELTLEEIRAKFREIGDHLSAKALENVVATGQDSRFTVGVALEPTDDGKVKFAAKGRVTMSTEKYEDMLMLDDQGVMDPDVAS